MQTDIAEESNKRDHKHHKRPKSSVLGQEKTIQSKNPTLWYLEPIANRMMNPRGLLKGEGVTTCFASHLACLKGEANASVYARERHAMADARGVITRCASVSLHNMALHQGLVSR